MTPGGRPAHFRRARRRRTSPPRRPRGGTGPGPRPSRHGAVIPSRYADGDVERTEPGTAREEEDMPRTRLDATDLVIAEAHLQIVRIHLRRWRALQRRLERRARILRWAVGKRPDQSRGGPRPNAEEVRLAERDLVDPAEAARRNAGGGARLRAPTRPKRTPHSRRDKRQPHVPQRRARRLPGARARRRCWSSDDESGFRLARRRRLISADGECVDRGRDLGGGLAGTAPRAGS